MDTGSMHLHRHSMGIRTLLAWVIASVLLLPFSAMSGIYCGEGHDGPPAVHCQHDAAQQVVADEKVADEDACCCNEIFHVLGCQHHCQTAGHASLIAASPCPFPFVGQVWVSPIITAVEDSFLEPPYHPPRV